MNETKSRKALVEEKAEILARLRLTEGNLAARNASGQSAEEAIQSHAKLVIARDRVAAAERDYYAAFGLWQHYGFQED